MSAAGPLQAAIHARLQGDAALVAMIGTDGVHDRLLTRTERPYVRIAAIESGDWSTASEPGEEHLVTLEVRAGEGGHRAAQEIERRVRTLLDASLAISGVTLVNFAHRKTSFRRDAKAKGHVAEMVFRAVTE